jgi:hypothetical protein
MIDDDKLLKTVRAITRDHRLTFGQRLIAITLADAADRSTGDARITIRTIAATLDCHQKTVETGIDMLRTTGWLRTLAENQYRLNWGRAV